MVRIVAILALAVALTAPTLALDTPDCRGQKIPICHFPPGNPDNPLSICINESGWPAHEAHGDYMGFCIVEDSDIECGEAVQVEPGVVEMEVVSSGFKMVGPFLEAAVGPATLDPFTCSAVDDKKWVCTWRAVGDPAFVGSQSVAVRFDHAGDEHSVECFVDEEDGLPVELIHASVE